MKFRLGIFSTLCLLFFCWPAFGAGAQTTSPVRLNELGLWPVAGDVGWVEVFNSGADEIDISGWMLVGDGAVLQTLPERTFIGSGQYRVFYDDGRGWPASVSRFALHDATGQVVAAAEWSDTVAAGLSLDLESDVWKVSYVPTAGRPNLVVGKEVVCPVTEPTSPPVSETPASTPSVATTGNIRINEVFPDPDGDETAREFVELYNADVVTVRVQGWKLSDPVKTYVIGDITLPPQQYLVLYRSQTGITLNNDKDTVSLADANGLVVSQFAYTSTKPEKTWNYGSEWYLAAPTPNDINAAAPVPAPVQTSPDPAPVPITPTPSPAPEPTTTQPTSDAPFADIRLNELYPVPASGEEEWIEIYNAADTAASLKGWSLSDGVRTYAFGDDILAGGAFLLVPQSVSKIQLNNSGDHVMLAYSNQVVTETTYAAIATGKSWLLAADGNWMIGDPTPATANIIAVDEPPAEAPASEPPLQADVASAPASTVAKAATQIAKSARLITFAQWPKAPAKTLVEMMGVVSVAPDAAKKRTFFLQPLSGNEPGIEVYFSRGEPAELSAGDQVVVDGEKSVSSLGERLLVRAPDDVEVVGAGEATSRVVVWSDLGERWHNRLVTISGVVASSTSKELKLENGGKIAYKEFKPEPLPAIGATVVLTGLYRQDASAIWVYDQNDIEIIDEQKTKTESPSLAPAVIATAASTAPVARDNRWMYVLGTAGAGGVASWYLSADAAKKALQAALSLIRK